MGRRAGADSKEPRAVRNGAVGMSKLVQSCFFGAQGQQYVNTAEPRRVTQEDVGMEVGVSPGTVDRCLKGVGDPKTILAVKEAAERMGYLRVDKWASIKKEFIKGYDWQGRPEIDEEAICILRRRGNHARVISGITGISRKRLLQIFTKHGLSTENLQAIKENGLSKRQRIEIKALNKEQQALREEVDFRTRGSAMRKLAFEIIKKYKNGISVEKAARLLSINKSLAFRCVYKTKAYKIIKSKKKRGDYKQRLLRTKTFSSAYSTEAKMMPIVHYELLKKYPEAEIIKEADIVETFFGDRGRFIRADFVVKQKNGKQIAVEVKNQTTTGCLKVLFGQCLLYKTCGYDVECVFPKDAYLAEFATSILAKNQVTFWTV